MEAVVTPFTIFVIVLVVLAIMLVMMGVKTVPQGKEYTIERFGRFTTRSSRAWHVIVPFIDRIGRRVN